ncbi:MAG: hypothetical protein NZ914_15135, partial [Gemmatales bacterium]|nr:hypothetical protein [Gemmatales bacterium]
MDKLELQVVGPLLYVARKQANGTDTIRPLLLAKDVVRFALSRASVWLSLLALVLCLSCIGLAVFAPIFAQTNKQDVPNAEGVDDSALRAELLAAWDRLYEKRNKLGRPYESSTWVRTYRDGVLVEEYRTFTKRNRSCVLRGHEPTLAKLNPGLDRHFIVCINPVYAFHIERENPEDPWLLRKVVLAS